MFILKLNISVFVSKDFTTKQVIKLPINIPIPIPIIVNIFWYKPEERKNIINELRRIGRSDLIDKLYGKGKEVVQNKIRGKR